jgi:DNA-binding transcriptional MerR regulator
MRIGEVARQAGIACSAIRFYEGLGLLPQRRRTVSGYRRYDQSAAGRLAFIRAGQPVGLRLDQLREVFEIRERGEAPCEHVAGMVAARMADIDVRIAGLQQLRADSLAWQKVREDSTPRTVRPRAPVGSSTSRGRTRLAGRGRSGSRSVTRDPSTPISTMPCRAPGPVRPTGAVSLRWVRRAMPAARDGRRQRRRQHKPEDEWSPAWGGKSRRGSPGAGSPCTRGRPRHSPVPPVAR